jgi:hypothetical protein
MDEQYLMERIRRLEYHQKLLVQLLDNPQLEFYKLIIKHGLTEQEVVKFFYLCDEMSIKMEEQKAEGFVYFHPLFHELSESLPEHLDVKEVVRACANQKLFVSLFDELLKYI